MGVDLETWVSCLRRHPRALEFDGLSGCGADPRIVAASDEKFMSALYDKEAESLLRLLDDFVGGKTQEDSGPGLWYANHLAHRLRYDKMTPELLLRCQGVDSMEPEGVRRLIVDLEGLVGGFRAEWSWYAPDSDLLSQSVRDGDLEEILIKHPPIGVKDHASGDFVSIVDVVFFCPGCGSQPVTIETMDDCCWDGYYCGLCGASAALSDDQTMFDFFDCMDIGRRTAGSVRQFDDSIFPYDDTRRRLLVDKVFRPYLELGQSDRKGWLKGTLPITPRLLE